MNAHSGSSLDIPVPLVTLEHAAAIAAEHFGLHGEVVKLGGERDSNFRITERDGTPWILKVGHPAESEGMADLQRTVLDRIATADPALPVPRARRASDGGAEVLWSPPNAHEGSPRSRVGVYSYLPGIPLREAKASTTLREQLGGMLGRLDRALAGLQHPFADHNLIWNASRVAEIRDLVDPADAVVRTALDHVATHLPQQLDGVRRQVLHNDANPYNILAEGDGSAILGIIDFGDVIEAPVSQEVATAAAYQLADADGIDALLDLVRGYQQEHPLAPEELATLYDLTVARLVLVVVITGWRAEQHPLNRDYILRNHRRARLGLERAMSIPCAEATARLLEEGAR